MNQKIISGIQQIGVGVSNVYEAWEWYKKHFGVDIRMFEEKAVAELMLPYTGGKPRARHAVLALNMQGGGGFEIWQYTERVPAAPGRQLKLGDLGIFSAKVKSRNVQSALNHFKSEGLNLSNQLLRGPSGELHFYLTDPFGNIFNITQGEHWFMKNKSQTGACNGAIIGVSDMRKSIGFYSDILGYDKIILDETAVFDDYRGLPAGNEHYRRVILRHSQPRVGAFSPLFGSSEIELVQAIDRKPDRIFEGRYWGDLGFIHLCYDITGMKLLREECKAKGFPFTVDAGDSFDMGEASGAFSYTEDPDGTLIEFVETHRIPILKRMGWFLNLKDRKPEKPLPRWLLKAISFNRVKEIKKVH